MLLLKAGIPLMMSPGFAKGKLPEKNAKELLLLSLLL